MDAIYRTQRHFYDLTRKYYLLGRDRLIRDLAPPPGGSVIEIGCGTGRNLIAAARAWPDARYFGIDISEAMLETARAKVAAAGLSDRIMLAQGDATAFDAQALFGVDTFDRVFQSYTLSMIPDWQGALREGAGKLAPGGRLDIVDFGQQEQLPGAFKRLLFGWLAQFDVEPRRALPEVLGEIARAHGLTDQFTPLYRGYAWAGRLSAAKG
ncbi:MULTISPECIES: class I SAM-dependent methyltransferase [unclassified Sphingomonas]|uniref:class I SAM-dependent methyltransferase n=1 Tax=unclassified Sphingomonas TaxID=196159 RepID=UPI000BDCDAB1|nr:MAG: SAM-dependent methyltransferase [Sphingomonas sp. 12-62-6]OYX39415.1 MAG: SAM-dependent methyltransferase [Sphingomonas sp. 32-62-10]OYY64200.1 MAG: SAM-dependent methyltransferase [Sphingomonas sp. 28-62-11]